MIAKKRTQRRHVTCTVEVDNLLKALKPYGFSASDFLEFGVKDFLRQNTEFLKEEKVYGALDTL